MKAFRIAALALTLSSPALHAQTAVDEQGFKTLVLGNEVWSDYPGIEGIKIMVVDGDPKLAGPYVIRVKFAPGIMSMPHYHREDRLVSVLKGTWYTGKSETFNPKETEPFNPGSFMKHPAGAIHYDGAKDEEVILQIIGVGPSGTIFAHSELGHTGSSR